MKLPQKILAGAFFACLAALPFIHGWDVTLGLAHSSHLELAVTLVAFSCGFAALVTEPIPDEAPLSEEASAVAREVHAAARRERMDLEAHRAAIARLNHEEDR
jgi:hypothetical protein